MARFGRFARSFRRSVPKRLSASRSFSRARTSIQTLTKPATNVSSQVRTARSSFLNSFRKTVTRSRRLQTRRISSRYSSPVYASRKKDIKIDVPILIQGNNECGPTSLAMVLAHSGISVNQHNMFSSSTFGHGPLALKRKAIEKGMTVRQENYGSLEDLAALVDKGIPALVCGIYGGKKQGETFSVSNFIDNASRAHWMVVTGYKRDDYGKITHVYFNDPNRSTTQCWTASDFQNKFWNDNIIPGGSRYYMAMAKKGTYQESALKSCLPSDKLSSSFKITLDVIDGIEKSYYAAENTVEDVVDEVEEVVEDIADAVEDVVNDIVDTAEDVWDVVTDTAEDVADAVEDAATSAWNEFTSWFS